jgi:hypothetical protein
MIAKLLAKNFERFGHTITPQRRRGALPKVVQGGGLNWCTFRRFANFQKPSLFADVGPISDKYFSLVRLCSGSNFLVGVKAFWAYVGSPFRNTSRVGGGVEIKKTFSF